MKCGGNSLWNNKEKIITVKDNNLVAIDGGNIVAGINLSDLNIPYSSVLRFNTILNANSSDIPIFKLNYGITFIAIKAKYVKKKQNEDCVSVTEYKFKDGLDTFRFGRILMLSSDCDNYINNILLTNSTDEKIMLEILIAFDNGIDVENIDCDCD